MMEIAKTVTTVKVKPLESREMLSKIMLLTPKHKSIAQLFDQNFWAKSAGVSR
ncbi:MAG: hypothetical protein LBR51_03540 [Bacteroidales bacterium]|nr:hypothetical protein [Bacteroidales bacterium]